MKAIASILVAAAAVLAVMPAAQARGRSGGSHHSYSSNYGSTGSHSVRGYTRRNGTYVRPSHATNRNNTKLDNWSTKGNVNPYTGKAGTVDPYRR